MDRRYRWVVIGGTFDHLHLGHQYLLKRAFSLGERVDIGLTKDAFLLKKPFSLAAESYQQRRKNLLGYLKKNQWEKRAKIISLNDAFGPSIKEKKYQAIIVSSQTKPTAQFINQVRLKRGLPLLEIIQVDLIKGKDGKVISSKRIRKGEIDRQGESYQLKVLSLYQRKTQLLTVTDELKTRLREPWGRVIPGSQAQVLDIGKKLVDYIKKYQPLLTIAVGDIVSYSLLINQLVPSIRIIDHRSLKKDLSLTIKKFLENTFHFKIVNQPGTLNLKSFITIKKAVNNFLTKKAFQTVFVDGEEDLLVLPAIVFSPLKTLIVHGHWQYGVVVVEVDEGLKKRVIKLLKSFQ